MSLMNNATHRTIASLNLPSKVPALITYAQNVVKSMTGNPHFPSPMPPLSEVTAAIVALSDAESATLTRSQGAVPARNAARVTLITKLQQLKSHIQGVADADTENAVTIITSAGIAVRRTPVRLARAFDAQPGPTTGAVKLVAVAAGRRASYEWEYSLDGGKTWIPATPTLQARTVITGLPAGTTAQFRYRGVTRTGVADWSAPVSLLVK